MNFIRIGDKLIRRDKIILAIDRILELRAKGDSQQDVAKALGSDRTFVSRLESLGEVRKGGSIALVGFPIANIDEISQMAQDEGVDYTLLMTEKERIEFVSQKSGLELLNEVMGLITEVRAYDTVILLGSNNRVRMTAALMDKEVIGIEIGASPLESDQYVDPQKVRTIIQNLRGQLNV